MVQPGLYNHNVLSRRCVFTYPDYGASRFLSNVDNLLRDQKVSYFRKQKFCQTFKDLYVLTEMLLFRSAFLWKLCSNLRRRLNAVLCRFLQLSPSDISVIQWRSCCCDNLSFVLDTLYYCTLTDLWRSLFTFNFQTFHLLGQSGSLAIRDITLHLTRVLGCSSHL